MVLLLIARLIERRLCVSRLKKDVSLISCVNQQFKVTRLGKNALGSAGRTRLHWIWVAGDLLFAFGDIMDDFRAEGL